MRLSKNELKYLRSLNQKKFRMIEKKFLLEGWRALKEALNSPFEIDYVALLTKFLEDPDYRSVREQIEQRHVGIRELSEVELRQLSETVNAQGVIALVRQRDFGLDEQLLKRASMIVAADAVTDPGNAGSILRSADWFGVDTVLLGKGCVELYNEKVIRSTAGSIFHLPVVEDVDLLTLLPDLRQRGYTAVALSADGKEAYDRLSWKKRNVLVFGNEAHGVSSEVRSLCDAVVKIPKFGNAESLNVGVACGIIMAHVRNMKTTVQ